ncbi:hypothetical protein [Serratia bockelmannii]|uniref:hypothetical protein n=1 Tax=Serratia bockelmannii TaxID=2703793 RepID=UPI003FA71E4B
MNRTFKESFNMLLERYNFSVNMGSVQEMTARRTLMFGMKHAIELAYYCEDLESAKELQEKLKVIRKQEVIPQPL